MLLCCCSFKCFLYQSTFIIWNYSNNISVIHSNYKQTHEIKIKLSYGLFTPNGRLYCNDLAAIAQWLLLWTTFNGYNNVHFKNKRTKFID